MTAPATTRRAGPFNGNGITTSFPFTFKVFGASDITVVKASTAGVESALVLTSDYNVTLNPDQDASPGGSITYPISGTPLATGEKLTAIGALPYDQTADLPTGGNYRAVVVENALDRTVFQVQQLAEGLDRALTLPTSSAGTVTELPSAASRANKLLGFNASGEVTLSAPADGSSAALAINLADTSAAVNGAGMVGYSASAAYADGTVGARLRQRIDVNDHPFLADPSKTASQNSAAIVLALAQCSAGKTLYFGKPGLYLVQATVVDTAIALPIGVDLEMAPGAWLTADTSFGSFITPLGRNRIRANIDGGGYPTSGGVTGAWTVENVGIRAYANATLGQGAADVTVEGCQIKNVSYAIQTDGAQRWTVMANRMERCKWSAMLMGYQNGFDCTGNLIFGNQFDDLGDYATAFYQVGASLGYGDHNTIAFNRAKNCNQATNGYAFGVEQGDVDRQRYFSFVGNQYETDGSVTVSTGGITVSTCSDTLVANNVLSCPATTQAIGVNSFKGKNNVIQGNMLDGWRECAISTDGSDGIDLIGNVIVNCGETSPVRPVIRMALTESTSNIRMSGGSITISAAYAYSGSTVASVLALAAAGKTVKDITISGTVFSNPNDRCISIEGTAGIPITNATVKGVIVNGIGSATFFSRECVYASYVNDLTVEGMVVMDAKRGVAAVNCDGATLARNEFKGSVTITTLYDITDSSNLRIRDDIVTAPVTVNVTPSARMTTNGNSARGCTSIVTEANGATGAIASGATVTHGMFAAPTQVSLTPNAAAVACAVTAKGATTFTVAFAGGGTQTFDWQAVIR